MSAELRRIWASELGKYAVLPPIESLPPSAADLLASLHLPTSKEITRYLTATGRPQAITAPDTPPLDRTQEPLSIEFWDDLDLLNDRDDRGSRDRTVTADEYLAKIEQLAAKIRERQPLVLGLGGVESLRVLGELAGKEGALADLGYTIVHIDGSESSGLENAILTKLPVIGEPALHLIQGQPEGSRGILEATLALNERPLTIFVHHGDEQHSASTLERLCIERRAEDPDAEIWVMQNGEAHRLEAPEEEPEAVMVAPGVFVRRAAAGLPFVSIRQKLGDTIPPHDPAWFRDLTGDALIAAMRERVNRPVVLAYYEAREHLFRDVDNQDGWVECVYTGRRLQTDVVPPPEQMNTEHTFPVSNGISDTTQVTDLHHLFPCDPEANTKRSSNPFGEVVTVQWEKGASKLGLDAEGRLVFEPPEAHKGVVARAMAYVAMCGGEVPEWMRPLLLRWNAEHPPSERERARNDAISRVQGNRNPFVDEPGLMDRLWR